MATSRETFNEVRDILKKLDRSIEHARDRRLSHEDTAPARAEPRPLRAKPIPARDPSDPWVPPASRG